MQSAEQSINLPPARLVAGQDDDLINWATYARQNGISQSAVIRAALREKIGRQNGQADFEAAVMERLDNLEQLIQSMGAAKPPDTLIAHDPLLDEPL